MLIALLALTTSKAKQREHKFFQLRLQVLTTVRRISNVCVLFSKQITKNAAFRRQYLYYENKLDEFSF